MPNKPGSIFSFSDAQKEPAASTSEPDNYGMPSSWTPVDAPPINPNAPAGSAPTAPGLNLSGLYASGPLPPNFGYQPSLVKTGYPNTAGPIDLMPIQGGAADNAKTAGIVEALLPKTTVTPVTPTPTTIQGGLIVYDHFPFIMQPAASYGFASVPVAQVGQLGWVLIGFAGNEGGQYGGQAPNIGQYAWSNDNQPSDAAWLVFNQANADNNAGYEVNGFAFGETSTTVLKYIFKLEGTIDSSLNFNTKQKSVYVGLVSGADASVTFTTPSGGAVSRPNFFIGARYDTSTTAPSINDSFFTLEVVANPIYSTASYTRNNTQGTTMVTTIAPLPGVWHTLTISFSGGNVTINLDGQVLTTAVPTVTVTATVSAATSGNGIVRLNWTPVASTVPVGVWGTGTSLTVSGFLGSFAPLNGTSTLVGVNNGQFVWFDNSIGNVGGQSNTVTMTGFPAYVPTLMFGNDDTAFPAGPDMLFFVDYFSWVYNSTLTSAQPVVLEAQ